MNYCGLDSWKTNSRIIRGVSNAPGGPFSIVQSVSIPFSHNPKIFQAPDGTYLLFSIGSGLWTTVPSNCSSTDDGTTTSSTVSISNTQSYDVSITDYPGPCGDGCGPAPLNAGCGLSLGMASSLEGPWTFQAINVTNQNSSLLLDCAHTNPSPWIFPNGSIIMAINAGFCHNELETIGLLQAPSYKGPWTFVTPDPILLNSDGSIHHCEDPFLWVTSRGYHLMVHNQQGDGVSRYAHSTNLLNWTLHDGDPGPYTDNIQWNDGTTDNFDVERPQFIFDPDTGKPIYLTNGALGSPSFTLFRPLRQTPPPPPPPPVYLVNNQNECMTTTEPFPCYNAGGFSICPLIVNSTCDNTTKLSNQWILNNGIITDINNYPINIDCDSCKSGSIAKLITSGGSGLIYNSTTNQIFVTSCTNPPMCLTTGDTGANPPCGGSEPWSSTQIHINECTATDTMGWTTKN